MQQVDQQFAFHRLARSSPQYRWWKPLLTALLGLALYLVFTVVLLIAGAIAAFITSADVSQYLDAAAAIDMSDPVIFAFTLVSLIIMIPALALAVLITGPRPVGLLSSVAGRIRWRWLGLCAAAALAVFLVSLGISTVLGFLFPEEAAAAPVQQETSTLLVLLALSILAVPFQAAAEEYVFRGFLMQAVGGWLRHPAFAILLPVPLFVVGHLYDPLGQADVAIFAVFAGWISWRTGGLEAAIAVHAINNMTIFVLGAFGLVDVNSTEGSVSGLLVSVATMAVTAGVIVRLANRRGIDRTRTVVPQAPLEHAHPSYALPAAGGSATFGYQVAPVRDPWAQHTPQQLPQGQPGDYDPSQYDPSRYGTRPGAPSAVRSTVPSGAPSEVRPAAPARPPAVQPESEMPPGPPRQTAPAVSPLPASATAPPAPLPTSAAPAGSTPARSATPPEEPAHPARDRDDRHPSGPAHPWGPGHPTGPSHPAGPGHPGSGAYAAER
ncbi:CPBP family glutamic-type intramembrane protease [Arthrobacter sp. MDT2-2]